MSNKTMFNIGDTVLFDCNNLNPDHWNNLSETQRLEYYGYLGYGDKRQKLFSFITEMIPQFGHCILIDISNGKIITMVHIDLLRLATEEEC